MFGTIVRACALASVSAIALAAAAKAATSGYSNVYTFCSLQIDAPCSDGARPQSSLIADKSGNLYGTTYEGGRYAGGTVFKVAPDGTETVLYAFCAQANCADGSHPWTGALYMDKHGNLYGTTRNGGSSGQNTGVVFKLAPDGTETVLYNFCSQGGDNCTDGADPVAGVIADKMGNLYGTTTTGGPAMVNGSYTQGGEVYKLAPDGTLTVLWGFCPTYGCPDGFNPGDGNLLMDKSGNLYGTTVFGGRGAVENGGTLYEVSGGSETVLYSFCNQQGCADGTEPYGGVVMDKNGNLYGTTTLGGAYFHQSSTGGGTAYMWSPATGAETVLYSFGGSLIGGSLDGANPYGTLLLTGNGKKLYGTTTLGGNAGCPNGCGIAFSLTAKNGTYTERILHSFYDAEDGDAGQPQAGLILENGYLYGTAAYGGSSNNGGVLFKLGTKGGAFHAP